ncbi:PAS domain S-box protein [Mariprofundus erugo]|nr:PAS domain S-box protein [Mariprofundus erugo]
MLPGKDMQINPRLGLRGKTAIALSGVLLVVLLVSSYVSYWQSKVIATEIEQGRLMEFRDQILRSLNSEKNNLLALRDVPPVAAIIRARDHQGIDPVGGDSLQQWRQRLAVIFSAMLGNHAQYFQISYLDSHGHELVRVGRAASGAITVVAEQALQSNAAERYVSETMRLKNGQIYTSDITLYREHGEIQLPHVPVLRIATPVYRDDHDLTGLVVIHLYSDMLFANLHSDPGGVRHHVVNDRGYYIRHDNGAMEFAWELGDGQLRLDSIEPGLAAMARSRDDYIGFHAVHDELDGFTKVYFSPLEPRRYWLLTLHIPEDLAYAEIGLAHRRMLVISVVMCLMLFLLTLWLVSRRIVVPIVQLAAATRALKAGDAGVRVDTTLVTDELQTLYEAINDYATQQQQANHMLQLEVELQTKRLAAVIDHILDGIITIAADGTIRAFNPAACRIFGYSSEEVIGQNVNILMPEPYHSEHDSYLRHYASTGVRGVIGIGREVTGRRKDGAVFPMELAVSELSMDGTHAFVGIIRDISERKSFEQKIVEEKDQLAAVINHVIDGIITISATGTIESFNPAARKIFAYSNDEVMGRNVKMLMAEPYHSEHDGYLQQHAMTDEKHVIGIGREVTGRRKDGSTFPMELAVSEVMINHVRHYVGIIRDISERKCAEEKIRKMAHYDHLTGLPNRVLFNDRLGRSLMLAARNRLQISLLFIDLDGFKAVNDTLGHEAGDRLLQSVAARLSDGVREVDTVARLGGDEFAVILFDVKGPINTSRKAGLIIDAVSAPYPEIGEGGMIGCSIGIALFPDDATDRQGLLSKADAAMYTVKKNGKNHFHFYHDGVGDEC